MSLSRIRTAALVAVVVTAVAVTATQSASARTVAPRKPKTHTVQMITQAGKQLFEPVNLTIQAGDTVEWLAVSGSHNVGFWKDSIPAGAAEVLAKVMPDQIAPLLGERKPVKGDKYVVVFTGAPKGLYRYYCKPHINKMMFGTLTVQ
ncbi:MAG: hypothetical protein H7Z40_07520 [Phycisphaerae bacterium]|nr:hypothetical protein [Gemmatimonadaceae bacterium]